MESSVVGKWIYLWLAVLLLFAQSLPGLAQEQRAPSDDRYGAEVLPGIIALTGHDLKPGQTSFELPELADPYVTLLQDSVVISGTAQYHLKFRSVEDLERGGPYQIVWNRFHNSDGSLMAKDRNFAHSWDLKPALWVLPSASQGASSGGPSLWSGVENVKPTLVWYGGSMRRSKGNKEAFWPQDNFSRDVFAFVEKEPGKWFSLAESVFAARADWPRPKGNYLGHRYGHQMVMIPGATRKVPAVFYEEVTEVRANGSPLVTSIFMDEMESPFRARGNPVEVISPLNPATGKLYPSASREDGSGLVEGPLYFRFMLDNEEWEAVGFSAGSFYGRYPTCFASRKVADGLRGKPFQPDLNDEGTDLRDAGAELGRVLSLAGGPGRPAVITGRDGMAVPGKNGMLRVLVHGYRKDILPDNDYSRHPTKYRFDQMFRVMIHAYLRIEKRSGETLRFQIVVPDGAKPDWTRRPSPRLVSRPEIAKQVRSSAR